LGIYVGGYVPAPGIPGSRDRRAEKSIADKFNKLVHAKIQAEKASQQQHAVEWELGLERLRTQIMREMIESFHDALVRAQDGIVTGGDAHLKFYEVLTLVPRAVGELNAKHGDVFTPPLQEGEPSRFFDPFIRGKTPMEYPKIGVGERYSTFLTVTFLIGRYSEWFLDMWRLRRVCST